MLNINCIGNKIYRLPTISQKQFSFEYFNTNLNNMKEMWKGINDLLNRKNKKSKSILFPQGLQHNRVIRDPTRIPNILNDHFATVGQRLASLIAQHKKALRISLLKLNHPIHPFSFNLSNQITYTDQYLYCLPSTEFLKK